MGATIVFMLVYKFIFKWPDSLLPYLIGMTMYMFYGWSTYTFMGLILCFLFWVYCHQNGIIALFIKYTTAIATILSVLFILGTAILFS